MRTYDVREQTTKSQGHIVAVDPPRWIVVAQEDGHGPAIPIDGQDYEELYSIESQGSTPFADFGDSGSLVIEVDAPDCPRAVGLIIGVSSDLTYALAVPIRSVLDIFKVTIVSGHNV